ncbi:MAG: hypothetical protein JST68_04440 [Bacteroidetes bacterium]|nr:hypothetical protein [Bacteroidota bacterium]
MRTSLFGSQNGYDTFERNMQELRNEIWAKDFDYILNVNVSEWLEYFKNKYEYISITLYLEQASVQYRNKHEIQNIQSYRHIHAPIYNFNIEVPFIGSSFLFCLKPSNCRLNFPEVEIPNGESGKLIKTVGIQNNDPNQLEREKQTFLETLRVNTENMNNDVSLYNTRIPRVFQDAYNQIKEKAEQEQRFFKSMNIEINKETDRIFKVPVIERKKIPEPILDKGVPKKYITDVPAIDDKSYHDIVDTIYTFFKAVEKKPAIYESFNEEGLRDYVLPTLETRYNNVTVTGETFNKGGKTDILIRYTDGTNLFVAECKFWGGEALLHDTINQLFDRYLTWRDSKTAIILFVKNKDFSNVLKTIQESIPKHEYYLRKGEDRGESSFSYIFHFPGDKGKAIYTQIMAFHLP